MMSLSLPLERSLVFEKKKRKRILGLASQALFPPFLHAAAKVRLDFCFSGLIFILFVGGLCCN